MVWGSQRGHLARRRRRRSIELGAHDQRVVRVSNDNPFSESHFRTLKYRPDFPERFGSREHARQHSVDFFKWYNHEHCHSGLALMTPHDVHHGRVDAKLVQRSVVLSAAFKAHPERFTRGLPMPEEPRTAVWINPPKVSPETESKELAIA